MSRTTNNSNRKHRKLAFHGLEARCLMAGDVHVDVSNGDLLITGDSYDNAITMIPSMVAGVPVPGKFFIQGLAGTTIDGEIGLMVQDVTRNFIIDMKDGSDTLVLGANGNPITVPNDLNINMGNGDLNHAVLNDLKVRDDVTIVGGTGTDNVTISRTTIGNVGADGNRNDLTIKTGLGAESVFLQYTSVKQNLIIDTGGDSLVNHVDVTFSNANDLTIKTGMGADTVNLQKTLVRQNLSIDTGYDSLANQVDLNLTNVGNNATIRTGLGADLVNISTVDVNKILKIETRDGKDDVRLNDTEVDQLFADLGAGDLDVLALTRVNGRTAELNGGIGELDQLWEVLTTFRHGRSYNLFERLHLSQ